mmetsp:Transcript_66898/g.178823  ORF Transcript_66898/g.178823 Transcript_66898/m.178823 type:complete len:121 (+) Transcript_66898:110-472(+)
MAKKSIFDSLGLSETVSSIREKINAGTSGAIFRRTSGVADVIVVEHEDLVPADDGVATMRPRWVCSDFIVHAGRDAKLGQDYEGVSVEIFINEKLIPGLEMKVRPDYRLEGSFRGFKKSF